MNNNFDMELVKRQVNKYKKATKKEKGKLLTEYCQLTRVSRNLASKRFIKEMKNIYPRALPTHRETGKRGRKPTYLKIHTEIIRRAWELSGEICAERLYPMLYSYVKQLEVNRLLLSYQKLDMLTAVSVSEITLKRIVSRFPKTNSGKKSRGNSDLYRQIPIQAYFGKNSAHPGYLEIDYVEHNGGNSRDTFAVSGSYVDIFSGWIARSAGLGKSQLAIAGIHDANSKKIHHQIHEYHPDNAKPILRLLLLKKVDCEKAKREQFALSLSRPYHKEDNGHVEQKNGDKVRKLVGYHRFDTAYQVTLLNLLYEVEDLISNFFLPSFKLITKLKDNKGRLIKKVYDKPKTSFVRLMESDEIDEKTKTTLKTIYKRLNLVSLRKESDQLQQMLYQTIISRKIIMIEPENNLRAFQGT